MRQVDFDFDSLFGREVFAYSLADRPAAGTKIWAVDYGNSVSEHSASPLSIPKEVLDHCLELSENRWTGWAFKEPSRHSRVQPLLLFADPTDAMLAELLYSN